MGRRRARGNVEKKKSGERKSPLGLLEGTTTHRCAASHHPLEALSQRETRIDVCEVRTKAVKSPFTTGSSAKSAYESA